MTATKSHLRLVNALDDQPKPTKKARARAKVAKSKSKSKKAKQPTRLGQGRATYALDAKISVLVDNPKRPGSAAHARFERYAGTKTVAEFLAAGGKRIDLAWDVSRGFVEVK